MRARRPLQPAQDAQGATGPVHGNGTRPGDVASPGGCRGPGHTGSRHEATGTFILETTASATSDVPTADGSSRSFLRS